MTIYLYVKTHRKTGLKYLGKTIKDPHKYRGSGKYWKEHIKKHGYDVDTRVLCECNTNEEVKEHGLYYSTLWNIVESNEWANLKVESGDGIDSITAKNIWEDNAFRQRHLLAVQEQWKNPEFIAMQTDLKSERCKRLWENNEYRKMMSEKCTNQLKERWENPNYVTFMSEMMSGIAKKLWSNSSHRAMMSERMSGENHPHYDSTIYLFKHKDGRTENCTRLMFYTKYNIPPGQVSRVISGKRKSVRGWTIIK